MRNATGPKTPSFAWLVQQFFTEYLVAQRALSPCTVACYRDALMLFLAFAGRKLGKEPSALRLSDIQSDLILAFLDHLERERHCAVRTRNLRLTALRAFLKFAGRRDVSALHVVEQALAVPMKRSDRPMLGYLTREEMMAASVMFHLAGVDKQAFIDGIKADPQSYKDWAGGGEWNIETGGKEDDMFSPFLKKPFDLAIRDGLIPASLISRAS